MPKRRHGTRKNPPQKKHQGKWLLCSVEVTNTDLTLSGNNEADVPDAELDPVEDDEVKTLDPAAETDQLY